MSTQTLFVPSATRGSTSFLEIHTVASTHGWKLSVRPTPVGRKQLNNFWPEWLRDKLLYAELANKLSVEIQGKFLSIWVSESVSPEYARSYVTRLAYEIRPVERPSFVCIHDECERFIRRYSWEDATNEQLELIGRIQLPSGARVNTRWYQGFKWVREDGKHVRRAEEPPQLSHYFDVVRPKQGCPLKIGELSRIFEYKLTLAVANM